MVRVLGRTTLAIKRQLWGREAPPHLVRRFMTHAVVLGQLAGTLWALANGRRAVRLPSRRVWDGTDAELTRIQHDSMCNITRFDAINFFPTIAHCSGGWCILGGIFRKVLGGPRGEKYPHQGSRSNWYGLSKRHQPSHERSN